MQHSTMTYAEVEAMIQAGAATGEPGATPFLRTYCPRLHGEFTNVSIARKIS